MKEYNTEEYFKKHGFTDGGYVNKCEPKFRKEFFCEFPKEPNFFMIKTKYDINDIVVYDEEEYLVLGVIILSKLYDNNPCYSLKSVRKEDVFYCVPENRISRLIRSPKYKKGDIINLVWSKIGECKILGVKFDFEYKDFSYEYWDSSDNHRCGFEWFITKYDKKELDRNKFKLGDIVKWTGYKKIDFKITSIIEDGKTFCYSLEATSGICGCDQVREEDLTLVTECEINMNVNLKSSHWTGGIVPSCEKIVASKNNITEEELSKAIVLYKTLKTI